MTDTMRSTPGEAADAALAVGSQAKDRAGDVATVAGDEARYVVHDAQYQAREVVERSREQLRTEASQQTERLASTLRDVGDELRAMSRGEASPDSQVSSLTSQFADTVSNAAGRLSDGGFDGAIADVKRFARNRPGMFLIGALGAGFMVGRIVKAVDTGALMQATKADEGPDIVMGQDVERSYSGGTGTVTASSSFDEPAPYDPQSFEPPPSDPAQASSLPPPPGAVGFDETPEVP